MHTTSPFAEPFSPFFTGFVPRGNQFPQNFWQQPSFFPGSFQNFPWNTAAAPAFNPTPNFWGFSPWATGNFGNFPFGNWPQSWQPTWPTSSFSGFAPAWPQNWTWNSTLSFPFPGAGFWPTQPFGFWPFFGPAGNAWNSHPGTPTAHQPNPTPAAAGWSPYPTPFATNGNGCCSATGAVGMHRDAA